MTTAVARPDASGISSPAGAVEHRSRPPADATSRRTLLAGRVLLIAGSITALFVLFELSLSGVIESRAQSALLDQFKRDITSTRLDASNAPATEGSAVALLSIPRLGVQQLVIEGTTPNDLKSGPGHLRGTPMPGEYGNVVVAGRRTTYGGPFANLSDLVKNDTITAVTGQGYFTYKVRSVSRVSAGQPDPLLGTSDSRLTLITSDPAYLATGRLVVSAILQGRPVGFATRPPVLVGTADLGLAGDPLGLALGLVGVELLAAAMWITWRLRGRWPPAVLYMLSAPLILALLLFSFTNVDSVLPGTL